MADYAEVTVEEIADDDELYRRVHPHQFNAETGEVSSAAFKNKELSVDVARMCSFEPETTAQAALSRGKECAAVVSFTAGFARKNCAQEVEHDPLPAEHDFGLNPAHALVKGNKEKSPKAMYQLRSICKTVWLFSETEEQNKTSENH